MKTRSTAIATVLLVFAALLLSAPASHGAPGKTYSSCAKLTNKYKHGVAKSAAAANRQYRNGNYKPAVKSSE